LQDSALRVQSRPSMPTSRARQAVILAGGLATRMYPRTRDVPKFLLPVAGRPFGHRLLERLAHAGYTDVVLCTGHLAEAIRSSIGDGRAFGLRVTISDEGETRLGTAGALRHALDALSETFLVTYGDSYLPFDYASPLDDLEAHPGALGTMSVFYNEDRWDTSNCEVKADQVVRYEKRPAGSPRDEKLAFIDYGAIALRREVVTALPEGPSDLAMVQRDLAHSGKLRALVVAERFHEIGSEAGLADLEAYLAGQLR
jgi:N-acetyl-alpha-D-muramate 1-phosphate uridylyltransferase